MTDLDRIAAEIVSRRRFQTIAGEPERLPDGTSEQLFPMVVQETVRQLGQPDSWRQQVRLASLLVFCEENPERVRSALLGLGARVAGWIADLDSREPALVPAKQKQKELTGAGVAG